MQARAELGAGLYDALLRYHQARVSGAGGGGSRIAVEAEALAAKVAKLADGAENARLAAARAEVSVHRATPHGTHEGASLPLHMDPHRCYGMKPCLHTTAEQRVHRGCLDGIWRGVWAIGLRSERAKALRLLRDVTPLIAQHFTPTLDCDAADVLVLSPLRSKRGDHVSVAQEEHAQLR